MSTGCGCTIQNSGYGNLQNGPELIGRDNGSITTSMRSISIRPTGDRKVLAPQARAVRSQNARAVCPSGRNNEPLFLSGGIGVFFALAVFSQNTYSRSAGRIQAVFAARSPFPQPPLKNSTLGLLARILSLLNKASKSDFRFPISDFRFPISDFPNTPPWVP